VDTTPETPADLLDALVSIFPRFGAEWEDGEAPETFHGVKLRFSTFFDASDPSATPVALGRLGGLINRAVAGGGPLENAVSTCLLEHLHRIGAWQALRPYLSDSSRRRSRA
jgi:hypothetical protein